MTLILSVQGERLIMLSDLLISRQGKHTDEIKGYPFRPEPHNLIVGDLTISGLFQKSIRLDNNHLLQWSGNKLLARLILKELAQAIQTDPDLKLIEFMKKADIAAEQLADISLIYQRLDENGEFFRESFNAKRADVRGADAMFSGTGDFNFLDDMRPTWDNAEENPDIAFVQDWFARVGYALLSEYLDQEDLNFGYGGWFEFTFLGDSGFEKQPYLIKIWEDLGTGVISRQCVCGWYCDEHLYLLSLDTRKPQTECKPHITMVSDPLDRVKPSFEFQNALATFAKPAFQIHLIYSKFGKVGIVAEAPLSSSFQIKIENGQIKLSGNEKLPRRLHEALTNPGGSVLRPFS